jgi:peroxiredoxin
MHYAHFAAIGAVALMTLATGSLPGRAAQPGGGPAAACQALGPRPMTPAVRQGQAAPNFELRDAAGRVVALRSLRGRPVLINFWATWCTPCAKELPALEKLSREMGVRLAVVAVSVDSDWAPVRKFFASGTDLHVLLDKDKTVAKRFGTEKFPETFLIDSSGRLVQLFYQAEWDSADAIACVKSLL